MGLARHSVVVRLRRFGTECRIPIPWHSLTYAITQLVAGKIMKLFPRIALLGFSIMTSFPDGANRLAAEDAAPQTLKLLKTFNDEFVAITPGEKDFPASFVMGSEKGPDAEKP